MVISRYCKVDIVQRHMADPCELHGTEEFLCFSLSCLLQGSLPMSANTRRFPVLWMFFLFEGKAATKEWWPSFEGAPPRPASACSEHVHTHQVTLPARALRHSSKSPGPRPEEGPACSGKHLGEWVDLGSLCSEVCLSTGSACSLPTPDIHYSSWWQRDSAGPPAFLHWLFLQRGDRHRGSCKFPAPALSIHGGELTAGGAPLPGSFPPALLWPEGGRGGGWGMSFN